MSTSAASLTAPSAPALIELKDMSVRASVTDSASVSSSSSASSTASSSSSSSSASSASSVSSSSTPAPTIVQLPAQPKTQIYNFRAEGKPEQQITGLLGKGVRSVRNLTGANGPQAEFSDRMMAGLVRALIIITTLTAAYFTLGLALVVLIPFVVEWKKQGDHLDALDNWKVRNKLEIKKVGALLCQMRTNEVAPLATEIATLKQGKIGQLVTEVTKLKGDIDKLTATNAALDNIRGENALKIGDLTGRLDDATSKSKTEIERLSAKDKTSEKTIQELHDQLGKLKVELTGFREVAKNDVTKLATQVTELTQQKAEVDKQVLLYKTTGEGTVKENIVLRERQKELETALDTANKSLLDKVANLKLADEKNAQLEKARAAVQKAFDDYQGNVQKWREDTLKPKLQSLRHDVETLTKEKQGLETQLKEWQTQASTSRSTNDGLKQEIEKVKAERQTITEKARTDLQDLTAKLATETKLKDGVAQLLATTQDSLSKSQTLYVQADATIKQLTERHAASEAACNQLRTDIELLKQEHTKAIAPLNEQIFNLGLERTVAVQRAEKAEAQVTELKIQAAAAIEDIEAPAEKDAEENGAEEEDFKAELDNLPQQDVE